MGRIIYFAYEVYVFRVRNNELSSGHAACPDGASFTQDGGAMLARLGCACYRPRGKEHRSFVMAGGVG